MGGMVRPISLPAVQSPVLLTLVPAIATGIGRIGQAAIYFLGIRSGISTTDFFSFTAAYGLTQAAVLSLSTLAQTIAQISPCMTGSGPYWKPCQRPMKCAGRCPGCRAV